jgi:hypothetical protein
MCSLKMMMGNPNPHPTRIPHKGEGVGDEVDAIFIASEFCFGHLMVSEEGSKNDELGAGKRGVDVFVATGSGKVIGGGDGVPVGAVAVVGSRDGGGWDVLYHLRDFFEEAGLGYSLGLVAAGEDADVDLTHFCDERGVDGVSVCVFYVVEMCAFVQRKRL